MILTDSHMHTAFSSDSDTPMETMIQEAIQKGLTSICITDHHEIDYPYHIDNFDFQLDTPSYIEEFHRLKERYGKKIDLRIGVELGIMPDTGDKLKNYLTRYGKEFDFVLGSTHVVNKVDPYYFEYYKNFKNEQEGIHRYFEENMKNLEAFDQMDSFGHYDYAVRYAPNKDLYYKPSDHTDITDIFLRKLIDKGIALELNTAGLKYGMKQANPHIEILTHYRNLGGELLTIGADGHKPEHIAWDFKTAEKILKEAGFSYYTVYRKRKPEMVKL